MRKRHHGLLIPAALSILLSGALAGCGNRETTGQLISDAKQYLAKGESSAAIIQLKNVLQKAPGNIEARALLGRIYVQSDDPASAEKELRKALELGGDRNALLPVLGRSLLARGQYRKVLDEIKFPGEGEPDAAFLALRGNAELGLGRLDDARDAFERALAKDPDSADALMGQARLLAMRHDPAGAAAMAERATAKHPDDLEAWLLKGDVLRINGNLDGARAAYAKAIALRPDDAKAYFAEIMLEIQAGQFDSAGRELAQARKHAPHALQLSYAKALLEFRQGRYEAALAAIREVLRYNPDHMPSVLLAGATQYALGTTQEAEQQLKKFLERHPDDRYATRLLGAALLKNGETERALATLQPLLKDDPEDLQLLTLAGNAYMQAREYAKATDYFEKASALAPKAAGVHAALGLSRLAQGENARGLAELEQAADLEPTTLRTGVLLVMTHLRLHEFDAALAAADKLQKVQPSNPLLFNLRGGAQLGKGDESGARASFGKALALQPDYFPALANLAELDVRDKKPEDARKRLQAYLDMHKNDARAMMALAGVMLAEGRSEEATRLLEQASEAAPGKITPALMLAANYQRSGQPRKALAVARKLQATRPDDPVVLDLLARSQFATHDITGALQTWQRLTGLKPESVVARFQLARAYAAAGRKDDAEQALGMAVKLQPEFAPAQRALALLAARTGDFDRALGAARALQQQPANAATGFQLEGDLQRARRKPELALKAYERALSIAPGAAAIVGVHRALTELGRSAEAEARILKWLAAHPTDLVTRSYLGDSYLAAGQNGKAIDQYQAVLRDAPSNAAVLNNLAIACQRNNDPRALQFAEKAYAAAPQSYAVMDTLGWTLVQHGSSSRALPLLEKAAAAAPAPAAAEIRLHYARGLLKAGETSRARSELGKIVASNAESPQVRQARALLHALP